MIKEKIFTDRSHEPTENELSKTYGVRYKYWLDLINFIELEFGKTEGEWKYYGSKSGWTRKLLLKKRNLLFFIPYKDRFVIGMVFGDKAVAEIRKSNLPKEIINEIGTAKNLRQEGV